MPVTAPEPEPPRDYANELLTIIDGLIHRYGMKAVVMAVMTRVARVLGD